jgi:hypothetical protein
LWIETSHYGTHLIIIMVWNKSQREQVSFSSSSASSTSSSSSSDPAINKNHKNNKNDSMMNTSSTSSSLRLPYHQRRRAAMEKYQVQFRTFSQHVRDLAALFTKCHTARLAYDSAQGQVSYVFGFWFEAMLYLDEGGNNYGF